MAHSGSLCCEDQHNHNYSLVPLIHTPTDPTATASSQGDEEEMAGAYEETSTDQVCVLDMQQCLMSGGAT